MLFFGLELPDAIVYKRSTAFVDFTLTFLFINLPIIVLIDDLLATEVTVLGNRADSEPLVLHMNYPLLNPWGDVSRKKKQSTCYEGSFTLKPALCVPQEFKHIHYPHIMHPHVHSEQNGPSSSWSQERYQFPLSFVRMSCSVINHAEMQSRSMPKQEPKFHSLP